MQAGYDAIVAVEEINGTRRARNFMNMCGKYRINYFCVGSLTLAIIHSYDSFIFQHLSWNFLRNCDPRLWVPFNITPCTTITTTNGNGKKLKNHAIRTNENKKNCLNECSVTPKLRRSHTYELYKIDKLQH